MKSYFKRLIKYVLYDHRPQETYIRPSIVDIKDLFKNKVVLITGGSDGIGLEIAKKFDKENAIVIITGRNLEKLKSAVSEMKNATYFQNDISDINKQDDLINKIIEKYGKIDILVNNAGISLHEKSFLDVTEETFDNQFNTNLKGSYFLTQKIIKRMKNNLNIIFITSERGDQCDFLPYGLTKSAVDSLIKGLSCKYYKDNIRVNGVAPGVTVSNLVKKDKHGSLYTESNVSRRFYLPEEVAEIVSFLASDESNCISGEIIHTNDGNHLNPYWGGEKPIKLLLKSLKLLFSFIKINENFYFILSIKYFFDCSIIVFNLE